MPANISNKYYKITEIIHNVILFQMFNNINIILLCSSQYLSKYNISIIRKISNINSFYLLNFWKFALKFPQTNLCP